MLLLLVMADALVIAHESKWQETVELSAARAVASWRGGHVTVMRL